MQTNRLLNSCHCQQQPIVATNHFGMSTGNRTTVDIACFHWWQKWRQYDFAWLHILFPTFLFQHPDFFKTLVRGTKGRNEVGCRPGQEKDLAPSCSNLSSFGSKCSVLKKVIVTFLWDFSVPSAMIGRPIVIQRPGNCVPLASLITPMGVPTGVNNRKYVREVCPPPQDYKICENPANHESIGECQVKIKK